MLMAAVNDLRFFLRHGGIEHKVGGNLISVIPIPRVC